VKWSHLILSHHHRSGNAPFIRVVPRPLFHRGKIVRREPWLTDLGSERHSFQTNVAPLETKKCSSSLGASCNQLFKPRNHDNSRLEQRRRGALTDSADGLPNRNQAVAPSSPISAAIPIGQPMEAVGSSQHLLQSNQPFGLRGQRLATGVL
jgi:hypothetical protein